VALGLEEVSEGEGFEGGFIEKGFFGGSLLFGFEDEAVGRGPGVSFGGFRGLEGM